MATRQFLLVLLTISTGRITSYVRGGYFRDYYNIAIIRTHNVTIGAYTCDPYFTTITNQNNVTNIRTKIWLPSDCADAFEKGELQISGYTFRNIKSNNTSNFSYIERQDEDYMSVNISITLQEFTIKYDITSGKVVLPSGSECYYQNFICYDPLYRITVFWDKYEGNRCNSVSLLYYGPADLYTSETVPARKSLVLQDSNKSFILHISNNNLTLCEKIVVSETNDERLFISLVVDDKTLFNAMGSVFKEINPLNVLTFKEMNVDEELERYWDNKNLPEVKDIQNQNANSPYEGGEVTPVMKKEIEDPVSEQTISNRVEEVSSGTISDQQIIPNRTEQNISNIILDQQPIPNSTEQNISGTISDQQPKETRDHTKDNASQTSQYLIIACSILFFTILLAIITILIVYTFIIRKRDEIKPEESYNLCSENKIYDNSLPVIFSPKPC